MTKMKTKKIKKNHYYKIKFTFKRFLGVAIIIIISSSSSSSSSSTTTTTTLLCYGTPKKKMRWG